MTITITKPGRYDDLPADAYHADPTPKGSLSATWAKLIVQPGGPARWKHEREHPPAPRKVFDFGHAAHAAVLGVGEPVAEIPADMLASNGAVSTKEAKAFVAECREQGIVPLKPAEYQQVSEMAAAIESHPDAMAALEGEHEVSAFTEDDATGIWLRSRFDSISAAGVTDYKTVVDADPKKFGRRTAADLGYHQQAAFYLHVATKLGLIDQHRFRFILQEKTAPYLVSVVELSQDYIGLGDDLNRRAIDLFAECLATNTWPAFPGVTTVDPPMWLAGDVATQLSEDIESELLAYAARISERTPA